MRAKTFFTLCFALFLIFVFIGDKVLPKPLSTASLQTRTTMNNFLLGLFPTKSKTKDLTQEREKKLEQQLEQSGSKKKWYQVIENGALGRRKLVMGIRNREEEINPFFSSLLPITPY